MYSNNKEKKKRKQNNSTNYNSNSNSTSTPTKEGYTSSDAGSRDSGSGDDYLDQYNIISSQKGPQESMAYRQPLTMSSSTASNEDNDLEKQALQPINALTSTTDINSIPTRKTEEGYPTQHNSTGLQHSQQQEPPPPSLPPPQSLPGAYRMGDIHSDDYHADNDLQRPRDRQVRITAHQALTSTLQAQQDGGDDTTSVAPTRRHPPQPLPPQPYADASQHQPVFVQTMQSMSTTKKSRRNKRILMGGILLICIVVVVVGVVVGVVVVANKSNDDSPGGTTTPTTSPQPSASTLSPTSAFPTRAPGEWLDDDALPVPEGISSEFGSNVVLSGDGMVVVAVSAGNQVDAADLFPYLQVYEKSNANSTWIPRGQAMEFKIMPHVSLSFDGTILLVGIQPEDEQRGGRALVFRWNKTLENAGGDWKQLGREILGKYPFSSRIFGFATTISNDGSIIAVSDPGRSSQGGVFKAGCIFIFEYNTTMTDTSGIWTPLGQEICGEAKRERAGNGISLSGDGKTVAITSKVSGNDDATVHPVDVRVYSYIGEQWTPQGQAVNAAGDIYYYAYGDPVSLSQDGTVMAVGDWSFGQAESGVVQVFDFVTEKGNTNSGQWMQRGPAINGELNDLLGWSVSLSADGSIVAAGAPRWKDRIDHDMGAGESYVYQFAGGEWVLFGQALVAEPKTGDFFGWAVSLSADGGVLAIGDPRNSRNGVKSGSVHIYQLA